MKRLDWAEIIRLRDVDGLSFAEIGRRMGKSRPSINSAYDTAKSQGWTAEGPPEGTQEERGSAIPSATPVLHSFGEQETQELREILAWWRTRKRNTAAIPERNTHRTRRTYWIEDVLHEAMKVAAEREGVSQAELVNRALRGYIEGHRSDVEGQR